MQQRQNFQLPSISNSFESTTSTPLKSNLCRLSSSTNSIVEDNDNGSSTTTTHGCKDIDYEEELLDEDKLYTTGTFEIPDDDEEEHHHHYDEKKCYCEVDDNFIIKMSQSTQSTSSDITPSTRSNDVVGGGEDSANAEYYKREEKETRTHDILLGSPLEQYLASQRKREATIVLKRTKNRRDEEVQSSQEPKSSCSSRSSLQLSYDKIFLSPSNSSLISHDSAADLLRHSYGRTAATDGVPTEVVQDDKKDKDDDDESSDTSSISKWERRLTRGSLSSDLTSLTNNTSYDTTKGGVRKKGRDMKTYDKDRIERDLDAFSEDIRGEEEEDNDDIGKNVSSSSLPPPSVLEPPSLIDNLRKASFDSRSIMSCDFGGELDKVQEEEEQEAFSGVFARTTWGGKEDNADDKGNNEQSITDYDRPTDKSDNSSDDNWVWFPSSGTMTQGQFYPFSLEKIRNDDNFTTETTPQSSLTRRSEQRNGQLGCNTFSFIEDEADWSTTKTSNTTRKDQHFEMKKSSQTVGASNTHLPAFEKKKLRNINDFDIISDTSMISSFRLSSSWLDRPSSSLASTTTPTKKKIKQLRFNDDLFELNPQTNRDDVKKIRSNINKKVSTSQEILLRSFSNAELTRLKSKKGRKAAYNKFFGTQVMDLPKRTLPLLDGSTSKIVDKRLWSPFSEDDKENVLGEGEKDLYTRAKRKSIPIKATKNAKLKRGYFNDNRDFAGFPSSADKSETRGENQDVFLPFDLFDEPVLDFQQQVTNNVSTNKSGMTRENQNQAFSPFLDLFDEPVLDSQAHVVTDDSGYDSDDDFFDFLLSCVINEYQKSITCMKEEYKKSIFFN